MPGRAVGGRPPKGSQIASGPNAGMEVCVEHVRKHMEYDATGMSVYTVIPLYRKPRCADCKVERKLKRC